MLDFLKDNTGKLSIHNLMMFMAFFPATYVMIKINTEEALGFYLGAYVLGYAAGKISGNFDKTQRQVER